MKRNIVLLRVSTDMQDTEYQREAINRYLNDNNIIVKEDDWVEEDGVSGFKTKMEDRVGLMKIKQMALKGEIENLIIFNLDRIGRRMELIGFINLLDECGVKILSVTEGCLNKGEDTDSLLNSVKMWLAEYDSKKKSEYVKNGKRKSALEGNHISGKPTFGYDLKNKKLVINKEESKLIEEIFRMYITFGTGKTVDILRERRSTRRGIEWNRTNLKRTLKNTVYIGRKKFKDELLDYDESIRIISDELFYQVQELLDIRNTNEKGTETRFVNKSDGLFESILYHKCGDGNIRKLRVDYTNYSSGGRCMFYRCHHCKAEKYKDHKKTYSAKKLQKELEPSIIDLFDNLSVEDLEAKYNEDKKININEIINRREALEKELKNNTKGLENTKAKLKKALINDLDTEVFTELITEFKGNIEVIEKELEVLRDKEEKVKRTNVNNIKLIGKLKDFKYLYETGDILMKKTILQEFIDKIIIDKDDVEIKINMC